MLTLVIGNKNYSSWSLRPWLAMKMAGVAFEEVRVPLYAEGSKDKIRQFSPTGKVPCLIDEGPAGHLVVWDSLAICEYVNEQYAHGTLWPADAVARARLAGGDEAAQRERVRAELAQRYGALPWDVIEATLKQTRSQYETMNPAIARGAFQSQVDVAARNAGMRVPAGIVTSVLGARMQAEHLMPFRGEVVTVLTALIDRHANAATTTTIVAN